MSDEVKPSGGTSSSRIFEALRQDLVRGRFAAGEKLAINALRQAYGVGLSPLREALSKLAAYGLLIQENQRGFRVPALSQAELEDITRLRIELEVMAFERAIAQGDAQWEAELLGASHRLKRADRTHDMGEVWEALHTRFHRTLVAPCGSMWLLRFIEQLHDQFDRYRRLGDNPPLIRQPLDDQHQMLVELALARDAAAGRALLTDHIQQSFEVALAHYRQYT
ncbi:GntR family transcriptional regulator [Halomonas sp. HNIBRBA4712]|uniref:GntR family transcriptional regulator n=1 Tax=Halomonas sp. HNIBRBA4712 TaxID=3373087 RepID=UPI003745A5F3